MRWQLGPWISRSCAAWLINVALLVMVLVVVSLSPRLSGARAAPAYTGTLRQLGGGLWQREIGIRVSPSIVQANLRRFLWFIDTKVGQIVLWNAGDVEVSIKIEVSGIAQDEEGVLTFTSPSEEVVEALSISDKSFMLAPGASRKVSVALDPGYARRQDRVGLCAAIQVYCTPSSLVGAAPALLTSPRISIPVLARLPGNHQWKLSLEGLSVKECDGPGAAIARIKVRNESGTHVLSGGTLSLKAEGGTRGRPCNMDFPVAPGLVLPGCARWLEAEIPFDSLDAGNYDATLAISASGETALKSSFTINVDEFGCIDLQGL